jgi:hypothetical protein
MEYADTVEKLQGFGKLDDYRFDRWDVTVESFGHDSAKEIAARAIIL